MARILLFTGDGKGKTTAALGLALRAAGHRKAVLILQFIKNEPTGEAAALGRLGDVHFAQVGLGFVPPPTDPRFARHQAAARAGLHRAEQALASGVYEVLILDELCLAVALGLLPEADVLAALRTAGAGTILVLTGRSATPGLLELADTATDMRSLKHAYDTGMPAQEGVEL